MDRIMRLIVMYDLKMDDEESKKEYLMFRKSLIKRGYIMMQYSIYSKVVSNLSSHKIELAYLQKNIPKMGNIRFLKISENQYVNMIFIRGNKNINETINSESRRIRIDYEIN